MGLREERDFYRKLLALASAERLEPLLDDALALICSVTGARRAFLEVAPSESGRAGESRWRSRSLSSDDLKAVRTAISAGIIAEAVATGQTITTASALTDPRFRNRGSVQQNKIEEVLCAPIASPPIGVLYLQGTDKPDGFDARDVEAAELFCGQLAPLSARLFAAESYEDATAEIRQRFDCREIVGRSRALADLLDKASLIAPVDIDTLITGDTGTGKTLIAKAIARNSPRRTGPFVELNCAALPTPLIESELFGAVRGAHSTATRTMPGKVAAASGGTLFLDEVGDLPLEAQAKLLQLLQSREYYPLGATRPERADVRIIAATNAPLAERLEQRTFREDLYYRLNVIPLVVPPLVARREDIEPMLLAFVARTCATHGFEPMSLSRSAILACVEAPWPGNVRELENAVTKGVIFARGRGSQTVTVEHLFPDAEPSDRPPTFHEATRRFQRRFLYECLERNEWNVTAVATELDIARSHVYNLIKAHELERRPLEST